MRSTLSRSALFLAAIALLPLAGCKWPGSSSSGESVSSAAPVIETRNVRYEGILQKSGVDSAVGGTHFLALDQGGLVALRSDALPLDEYIDDRVVISGKEANEPQGFPVVNVTDVQILQDALPELGQSSSSSSSSEAAMSSSSGMASSSQAASSSTAASSSKAPAPVRSSSSSSSKAPVSSSAAAKSSSSIVAVTASSASSSQSSNDSSAKAAIMAKAAVSDATFTQKYCSTHSGFCVPVHKNWYYASFGATTNVAWHVEVGPSAVENVGDGVITVDLVSGAVPDGRDGVTVVEGETAAGFRAWTGGKHIVIRGPATLKSAIDYMTKGVTTL